MGILDEVILGDEPDWETDGYGDFDSNLIHEPCGTQIEIDAPQCPVCKVPNPVRAKGMI